MSDGSAVSVVLPTYNEAETVGAVLEHLFARLPNAEIVVVDDDSPDGTGKRVRQRYGGSDRVRVCVREDERGLGSAVLAGFDLATGDVYGVMDADLQHPPATMAQLVDSVQDGADIAIGSRHLERGGVASEWPPHRRVISHGADLLARLTVPHCRRLTDPMSGLFAVDADVVTPVRARLRPNGYKILLELLCRCPIKRIDEVPYVFGERPAGDSNLGPREYAQYVRHLSRLVLPARRPSVRFRAADVTAREPPALEASR